MYTTAKSLRKAVEKEYGCPLSDERWWVLQPDEPGPYDDFDVKEILKGIRGYKPRKEKERRVKRGHRLSTQWKLWGGVGMPLSSAQRLRPRVIDFRITQLGLKEPVSLESIAPTLIELGATSLSGGIPLAYPKKEKGIMYFELWEIGYVHVPLKLDGRLFYLPTYLYYLSYILGCHPAIALAFVMCDIEPKPDLFPTIIEDNLRMYIQVPNEETSPNLVRQAYTLARNVMIGEKRGISGKWARPRRRTLKVCELIDFINDNSKVSWKELFEGWNKEYPQWAYSNLRSMQQRYYEVKPKSRKGKQ